MQKLKIIKNIKIIESDRKCDILNNLQSYTALTIGVIQIWFTPLVKGRCPNTFLLLAYVFK